MDEDRHFCFVVTPDADRAFFDEKIGGAERQTSLIAEELSDLGFDVTFIVENAREQDSNYDGNVAFQSGYSGATGALNAPVKVLKMLRAMASVDADVYFVRGVPLMSVVAAVYAGFNDCKFVYSSSNDRFIDPEYLSEYPTLFTRVYLRSLHRADLVLAQTDRQRDLFARHHDITATIVPNGYTLPDSELVLPYSRRDLVLWVGRLDEEQKRPGRFLEIAERLPEVEFAMAAIPGDDESYNEEIRSRGERLNNFEYLGFVPQDEIDEYYRRSYALVNTSDYEGFPNTYLEAWRFGTPTLSVHHDVNSLLADERCGVLSGSLDSLTEDIQEIVRSEQKWSTLSRSARREVEEEYSISSCVETLLSRV